MDKKEDRLKQIRAAIAKRTRQLAMEAETPKEWLIRMGFYTKDGKLTKKYGGSDDESV